MKSIFVCNLLLLYCSISAFSQDNQMLQSSIDYGVKLGVNYSNNEFMPGSSLGFIGGCFLNLKLSERLSLQPEILYSMKGSSGTENEIKYRFNLNYIEFPLLFKIALPSFSEIDPNIFVAPGLSFNVTNNVKQSEDKNTSLIWLSTPTSGGPELILLFGGGVKIKNNTITFGLELRYTMGFRYIVRYEGFPLLSKQTSGGWEKQTSVISLIAILEI